MTNHAVLSPSSSAKWLSCPAAVAFESLLDVPDTGSDYADEGTAAHSVLEMILTGDEPKELIGRSIVIDEGTPDARMLYATKEMVDNAEIAVEYIQRLQARNSFHEEKVDFSDIVPHGSGYSDVILEVYEKVAPDKRVNTLYVIDYKYGKGVKVEAFENSQGMLYALGALNTFDPLFDRDIERVVVVIIQPRMDHIDEYETTPAALKAWGQEIKPKADLAYKLYDSRYGEEATLESEHFNPTKKGCQWCQGRRLKKCKAHAQAGYSAAVEGFDDLTAEQKTDLPAVEVTDDTLKDPAFLDNADLAAIWAKAGLFKRFIEELGEEIASRINAGQSVPGLRLVATEKPRAWRLDEEETIKALRTSGLQKKHYEKIGIISPTDAEKLLKEVKPKEHSRRYKRLEAAAVHRPPGNPKIIEDRKPAEDEVDDLLG